MRPLWSDTRGRARSATRRSRGPRPDRLTPTVPVRMPRARQRRQESSSSSPIAASCYLGRWRGDRVNEYALAAMDYRRLGSTGLKVSRLGLGCGNFGGIGSAPEFFGMGENEAQAFALMDRAFDAGINFFDTANAYGGGRSESCIGKWLRAKGSAVREQLLVSS